MKVLSGTPDGFDFKDFGLSKKFAPIFPVLGQNDTACIVLSVMLHFAP